MGALREGFDPGYQRVREGILECTNQTKYDALAVLLSFDFSHNFQYVMSKRRSTYGKGYFVERD